MKERVACFLVPVLTAVILLYQVLVSLQIAVTHSATLLVIGVTMAAAVTIGLLAAFAPALVRVGLLAACTLIFLDVTFHLSGVLDHLRPEIRERASRDATRIADIHRIKSALDQYVARVGWLPLPREYGEATGPDNFWKDWWDVSSADTDEDGLKFLDFLVEDGILPAVPVDPVNESTGDNPRAGKQYVYVVVPPHHKYAGGTCETRPNRWVYMVGITDLEDEKSRPPRTVKGSGCECLWREQPNYFQRHFDYIQCGTFEAPPDFRARASEARAQRAAAALVAKREAEGQVHLPADRRRVADVLRIQEALNKYIREIGPLPFPREYGEADSSRRPGFWQGYWDLSADDADDDGQPFLGFLVDSGILPSVPVDPENQPDKDGDPRGGRQYVYFVAPPTDKYQGGSCGAARNQYTYLVGVTDLRSEAVRPPKRITGSGCDCLWRDQPNFFQSRFDYLVCGTFEATPESRARAAGIRAERAAAMLAEKQATAAQAFGPQDQQRVADLHRINEALQRYIKTVGPLPTPGEYGEAEVSRNPGFWDGYWDVSAEDGDGDGKPFLDFLVDNRIMTPVPLDPDNERSDDGRPRGGRQYVYFVARPNEQFQGGTCGTRTNESVYMLGITDLRSELTRPPKKIAGSGCDCLWLNQPNYFQAHFDYVICGKFKK
jgi:hypothetical protein